MRAAVTPDNMPLFNYTLMTSHMRGFFSPEELKTAELVEPFSFTKGYKVIKTKAEKGLAVFGDGHLLFDLEKDPGQIQPITDPDVEQWMINLLVKLMKENDAPVDQFVRLGLEDHY